MFEIVAIALQSPIAWIPAYCRSASCSVAPAQLYRGLQLSFHLNRITYQCQIMPDL
ncbi:hypothetical protein [Leptolyngbya sp. O-77]|uniref:hypothetical protein n=1 Tax=Leptolyngbya sp. O-77 TaxID=1080068 RepID=UPI000AB28064|nr:hypothetical protein [Leptolyngbya sp. O-77]